MIENRPDKDRIKCPHCRSFLMEVKPRMVEGQRIITRCPKCGTNIEIKK